MYTCTCSRWYNSYKHDKNIADGVEGEEIPRDTLVCVCRLRSSCSMVLFFKSPSIYKIVFSTMSVLSLSGKSFVVQLTFNWQCLVFCRRSRTPYGDKVRFKESYFYFLTICSCYRESKRIVHTNGTRSLLDAWLRSLLLSLS